MTDLRVRRRRGAAALLGLLAWAAAAAAPASASAAATLPDPGTAVSTACRYLGAAESGDLAAARAAWRPADLARASRLGIRYRGLLLKVDGDGLAALAPGSAAGPGAGCRLGDAKPASLAAMLPGDPVLASVRVDAAGPDGGAGPSFTYLLARTDGAWRLASPVGVALEACATRPGAVAEGRYVRVTIAPGMEGRAPALAALDSFAALVLDRLQTPAERRSLLEREKIDYLFAPPDLVTELAGAPTVGVANLQVDAVVTSRPCHLHELVHALVNFRLQDLPLFALPVLQEGLAVDLGGRWGRAPASLAPVGRMFLAEGFVDAADLLTWDGFRSMGADMSYPAAGVVAGWLLDKRGADALLAAYRALSGPPDSLAALTADQVAVVLGAGDAAAFRDTLTGYLEAAPPNPLRAAAAAGDMPTGDPDRVVTGDGLTMKLWGRDGQVFAAVTAAGGVEPRGALLVPGDAATPSSALYAEQFPGAAGPTPRGALRFDAEEAGWYDYGRDLLLAKHVASFWPEPPAYDAATGTLRLVWNADAVPWDAVRTPCALQAAPAD